MAYDPKHTHIDGHDSLRRTTITTYFADLMTTHKDDTFYSRQDMTRYGRTQITYGLGPRKSRGIKTGGPRVQVPQVTLWQVRGWVRVPPSTGQGVVLKGRVRPQNGVRVPSGGFVTGWEVLDRGVSVLGMFIFMWYNDNKPDSHDKSGIGFIPQRVSCTYQIDSRISPRLTGVITIT